MKDADEGKDPCGVGAGTLGDQVVGTPPGLDARNNVPEPWGNHGTKCSNVLYADGHAVSLAGAYWEEWLSEHCDPD